MQIGWFSLIGIDSGPYFDHYCGRMGLYDLFMDPNYDSEVEFLKKLG